MPFSPITRIALTALLGLAVVNVEAEQPRELGADLKIRSGYALSLPQELARSNYSFGVNLRLPVGPGSLFGELGYHYKGGNLERVDFEPAMAGMKPVDPRYSVDVRKGRMDGVAVRLGWMQPMGEHWSWQAGLSVGGTRYTQEVIGLTASYDASTGKEPSLPGDYLNTYNGTFTQNKLTPSPFAGLVRRLDESGSLELNLLWLRYNAAHRVHVPGSASPATGDKHNYNPLDYTASQRRGSLHVELGYTFHF